MKVGPEVVTLLILLGLGALGGSYIAVTSSQSGPQEFSVETTDGTKFTLSEQRGKVVILDLFATWCASCQIVEANLKDAMTSWDNASVVIVSVGIDQTETMDDLRTYEEEHNITWTVAKDTDRVAEKYNTYEIARVVILDKSGNAVFAQSGITGANEFRSVVSNALVGGLQPVGLVQLGLLGLAMVAGAAAFFSPCAVGMLPAYVMRTVRSGPGTLARTLTVGGTAALGVLFVFFGVGGLALVAGPALTRFIPFLQPLVGFLLIVVGVLLLARPFSVAIQRLTAPLQTWAHDVQEEKGDRPGAYLAYGLAYGAAAAGCTAPVLLSVLVTATAYGPRVGTGIVLTYALTGAFFMVTLTVAASAARGRLPANLGRWARPIETASALLFVAGGLFLIWYATRAGTFAART